MSKVNFEDLTVRGAFDLAIKLKLGNPNTSAYDIKILAEAYFTLSKIGDPVKITFDDAT